MLQVLTLALDLAHFFARGLGFQRHLVARELDEPLGAAGRGARGQHLQAHHRADRAADELHDVVEAPADHVGERAFLALADGRDAIVRRELIARRRGAARQDAQHRHVVVHQLQRCADALVGQAHRDAVLLAVARREVARMRVVGARVGVHERLEHVIARHLVDALDDALVALAQDVGSLRPGLAGEDEAQAVVLHAQPPQLVHFLVVGGPGRVLAIEVEIFAQSEVRLLAELADRVGHALAIALAKAPEDRERRVERARLDALVEAQPQTLELGDVARQEVAARAVQGFQVQVEDLRGQAIVQRRPGVVRAIEVVVHATRDVAVTDGRRQVRAQACGLGGGSRRQRRLDGATDCGGEQQRGSDEQQSATDGGHDGLRRPAQGGQNSLLDS